MGDWQAASPPVGAATAASVGGARVKSEKSTDRQGWALAPLRVPAERVCLTEHHRHAPSAILLGSSRVSSTLSIETTNTPTRKPTSSLVLTQTHARAHNLPALPAAPLQVKFALPNISQASHKRRRSRSSITMADQLVSLSLPLPSPASSSSPCSSSSRAAQCSMEDRVHGRKEKGREKAARSALLPLLARQQEPASAGHSAGRL
ncbi:hypothetical protein K437DRAFT_137530 [Tilletiaria anomala UBC 951]|uniref:Uncharacterized protein n=1 Tax=Tilletiaria anomala (strain ATCC 24038 / CBS 436.72 / UBC 951) TaxID=1037660 RepID=A0A066VSR8_TILAU|nr:uncharacterized protein K437DRAFT_137530 [Tilletiaria anomala UBC 951]KDN44506.1 hypothetical protein K437DRAFT_137530 [Tilletiaria anomala UBC 951]